MDPGVTLDHLDCFLLIRSSVLEEVDHMRILSHSNCWLRIPTASISSTLHKFQILKLEPEVSILQFLGPSSKIWIVFFNCAFPPRWHIKLASGGLKWKEGRSRIKHGVEYSCDRPGEYRTKVYQGTSTTSAYIGPRKQLLLVVRARGVFGLRRDLYIAYSLLNASNLEVPSEKCELRDNGCNVMAGIVQSPFRTIIAPRG
ncbi:hypothetical protein BJ138DRAFT_1098570 [Hygrophoropsis aurantiaca]|uniref:Uncharacterized protein n=1 Tax=Hygrophoropsis aurantiaca TaxID=72124 RepID=A0ACB8ANY7_9AGAM|nr:hypothetical protein BJ138DRAFT_1098570 [Hygrophoropsis aurantiaca]